MPAASRQDARSSRLECRRCNRRARSKDSQTTSSTRSPPARWWSGRRPSSRSWSRTRSTRGRARVHVEIEDGGTTLVRVRDDGHGMSRADAELALERHATSKLRALEDLQRISTHGFRGEALPSIAAVSELVLRTRAEGEPAGHRGRGRPRPAPPRARRRAPARDDGRGARPLRDAAGPAQVPALGLDRGLARRRGRDAAGAGAARDGLLAPLRRAAP